ncbi:hypothetical protein ACFWEB_36635 [Streptomyces parvus]|uniref:hypothetical protein n=1 Tax=Streptomyces parvus TaxID=66428 RepID=UPI0036566400
MTPHIDEFLSRARLVSAPYTQADIDAAEARVLARLQAPDPAPAPVPAVTAAVDEPTSVEAALNLKNLCAAVVTHTTALPTLRTFLTPQLPEPPGARVLGCILQLAESEENARFWWQYAAGAGDPAASYCLYLHHRALGEHAPARWWHEQTELLQDTPSTDLPHTRGEEPDTETNDVPSAVTTALHEVSTTDASLLPTALRSPQNRPRPSPGHRRGRHRLRPCRRRLRRRLRPPPDRPRLHRPHPHPHRHRHHPHPRTEPTPATPQGLEASDRDRPPPPHLGVGMSRRPCSREALALRPMAQRALRGERGSGEPVPVGGTGLD